MADDSRTTIYVIGAGFTGTTIAAEIRTKRIFGRVVAFLDDDPAKIGTQIDGVPVLGPLEAAARMIRTTPADEAIIAIPSATRAVATKSRVGWSICTTAHGCMKSLTSGSLRSKPPRPVQP